MKKCTVYRRTTTGESQRVIAKKMGVSQATISAYERNFDTKKARIMKDTMFMALASRRLRILESRRMLKFSLNPISNSVIFMLTSERSNPSVMTILQEMMVKHTQSWNILRVSTLSGFRFVMATRADSQKTVLLNFVVVWMILTLENLTMLRFVFSSTAPTILRVWQCTPMICRMGSIFDSIQTNPLEHLPRR